MAKTPPDPADFRFNFEAHGAAFFDRELHRLRVVVSEQSDAIFQEAGVGIPSHCASVVLLLDENDEVPVTSIADALGYSHQLINQRLALLKKLGCVARTRDTADRRRSLVSLTKQGRLEASRVRDALPRIDEGIRSVFGQLGANLHEQVATTRRSLVRSPLGERAEAPE